jgi:hypothetical protein
MTTNINCRAFDSFAPAHAASGLPVHVTQRPLAPFCETPMPITLASGTDALQSGLQPARLCRSARWLHSVKHRVKYVGVRRNERHYNTFRRYAHATTLSMRINAPAPFVSTI